jgi:hypothetical protein
MRIAEFLRHRYAQARHRQMIFTDLYDDELTCMPQTMTPHALEFSAPPQAMGFWVGEAVYLVFFQNSRQTMRA